ncbi:uncharacterized protein LOC107882242 [Acyrthosiphon pisum]|uniref:Uncharacterized protein n=1 Tax=Acyrthosiphon pisum TaxID=7029 RepID=A0A8R2D0Z8_ACYPI|nr:uncharacterized protein LOC107882242 [Acyrthosiphon pisum]|eukprot:XP_016655805.1 PREDICTED: uncharacterized protein LOC107882242 [Acyrthosiphon pisum]
MDNVYKCRVCFRMYHDEEDVIDLSSEESKEEQIAAKILSALSIMITDHDPIKHICRICYRQVEANFRFATACRINNAKYIETLSNAPSNDVIKTDYNKFMRVPVHALFNKYQYNVKGLFDAVTSFLNDPNENLSSTRHIEQFYQYFGLHNPNSISNQSDIENDTPIGIPESSSVLEVNMSSTNEPNVKPIMKQKKTPKPKKAVASKKQTQKTSIAQSNLKTKSQLVRLSTSSVIEKKQTRKTSIALQNLKPKGQLLRSSTLPTTEQSNTSLTKTRPKRASAIDRAAENRKSGLYKLGRHIETKDGRWTTPMHNISFPMVQCPICDVYLYSPESRKKHEVLKHSSLLESIHEPVDIVSTPENTEPLTEQLKLFNYLKLCVTSKHKTKVVHQLAKRTNFLKALKTLGDNIIGSFKCNYCPYTTDLIFALWAHCTSKHLYLKCDSEKKTCLYCFLCNRMLTKRTTMLKHLNACINKKLNEPPITNNSSKRLICEICNECFDSLVELEKHTWGHAKKK